MVSNFWALSLAPVAKVAASKLSGPLFAIVLAVVFLREKFRMRRIGAVLFGFAGVMVIIRPGYVELDLGTAMALVSATAWAMMALAVKVLSRTESSLTMTICVSLFATPVTYFLAIPVWKMPELIDFSWMILLGGLGSLGHVCVAGAFRNADFSIVSPLDFLKLIWVALLGYYALGEVPTIWTWLGGAMIFLSTAYIAYRERTVKKPNQEIAK